MEIPPAPHPRQRWVFSVIYICTLPAGVKWYLIMALICILLKANDVEHFFMCLLATCLSSLVKHLLTYLPISSLFCLSYYRVVRVLRVSTAETVHLCFATFSFLPVHGLPLHCLLLILTKPHLQLKKFL